MNTIRQLAQKFATYFHSNFILIQAPGRINLIGEHTDYNEGFVLPAAIDRHIYFAVGKSEVADRYQVYSPHFDEIATLYNTIPAQHNLPSWAKYLQAAILELQARGYQPKGVNAVMDGNIPLGAGLSSSAALCCGFIFGIAQLSEITLSKSEIALIAQATEHRVGLNCGIMDQYSVMFGKANQAFALDCKHLTVEYFPLQLGDYSIVLINSNIKHELAADSGYNDRRAACERVVATIQADQPAINSLRDIPFSLLLQYESALDPTDFRRAKYVFEENQRVLDTTKALQQNQIKIVGQYLYQSQQGMQHEYQITIPEIDLLVELTKPMPEVIGARMVGGGFGGCTINLIQTDVKEAVVEQIAAAYTAATQIEPEAYFLHPDDGVRMIS